MGELPDLEPASAALLDRASSTLRALPESGWNRISASVIAAVRLAPRPGWPLDTAADPVMPKSSVGAISVSDHVLRAAMATALQVESACAPTVIELDVDGHLVRAVRIEMIAQYGAALAEVADSVRSIVIAVSREILGDTHPPILASDIEIVFTDVADGDPRA